MNSPSKARAPRWGVWATRFATSVAGFAERWCKQEGKELTWYSQSEAQVYCDHLMKNKMSAKIAYEVKRYE